MAGVSGKWWEKVGELFGSFHIVQVSLQLIWMSISFCIYSSFVPRESIQLISLLPSFLDCIVLVSLVQSSQWCWDGGAAGSCGYSYWKHLHWKKQDLSLETAWILMWPLFWRIKLLGNWKWQVKSPTTNRVFRHIAWAKSVSRNKGKFLFKFHRIVYCCSSRIYNNKSRIWVTIGPLVCVW